MRPFVLVAQKATDFVLFITRQKPDAGVDEFFEDEVKSMLEVGKETGVLKEEGKKMINSIFAFDDIMAHEIMTPRTEVVSIDADDKAEEYLDELMEEGFSRIPIYENDYDNIIGILNIKDFFIKAREMGFENVDLRSILRKPYFVPATKKIDSLFFDLQGSKQHIAILIDEYGGFSGIVTMEDIIEKVMGNIIDEYDDEEPALVAIDESNFMVSGSMNLSDLNDALGVSLKSDNIETVGGLLIDILGEIPEDNDNGERVIEYEGLTFKIESVKERRVEKVKLRIPLMGDE
jgi:putative hemolysin